MDENTRKWLVLIAKTANSGCADPNIMFNHDLYLKEIAERAINALGEVPYETPSSQGKKS